MTLQLFWDRAGSGDPLLLLHGIGSTHDDFAALRPRLDAEYRVLAPDLPGHGRSARLPGRPTIAAIAGMSGRRRRRATRLPPMSRAW